MATTLQLQQLQAEWKRLRMPSFEDVLMKVYELNPEELQSSHEARYKALRSAYINLPRIIIIWLSHWNHKTRDARPSVNYVCRKYNYGHSTVTGALKMAVVLGLMEVSGRHGNTVCYSFPLFEMRALKKMVARPRRPGRPKITHQKTDHQWEAEQAARLELSHRERLEFCREYGVKSIKELIDLNVTQLQQMKDKAAAEQKPRDERNKEGWPEY